MLVVAFELKPEAFIVNCDQAQMHAPDARRRNSALTELRPSPTRHADGLIQKPKSQERHLGFLASELVTALSGFHGFLLKL
jgi:hypothetical protein